MSRGAPCANLLLPFPKFIGGSVLLPFFPFRIVGKAVWATVVATMYRHASFVPQHFFDDAQTCGTFVIHGALAPCSIDSDVGATVIALKHLQTVVQDKSHGSVEKRCWQNSETTKIESEWQEQRKKCYHNESILLSEQKMLS